ncbi:MAG: TlpA disulfide reductase family protein [Actinomycetota bacterium]
MIKRLSFVVLPLVFVVFIAVAVFGKSKPLLVGQVVPGFTAKTFEGNEVSLSDFRGRPVLVNFWASWCIPCQDEADDLAITYENFSSTDLVMLGVNSEDLREDAEQFIKTHRLRYTNLRDSSASISKQLYGVRAYPETMFIDRQGKLVARVFGPMTAVEIKGRVESLMER